MACPYANTRYVVTSENGDEDSRINEEMANSIQKANDITYTSYLQIDKLLDCQKPESRIHEEHLFIVTHQAFELWFKQIIVEIDSVRRILASDHVEESNMLTINHRLERCVLIMKLLGEQFQILETMTPHDFMDFRIHLGSSSGFQSHQFRLMENKLGLVEENRIKYNKKNYRDVFKEDSVKNAQLEDSLKEKSLHQLIERWLERTPGLEPDVFNFWAKYKTAVDEYLTDVFLVPSEIETDTYLKKTKTEEYLKEKMTFDSLFDTALYQQEMTRRERRMSYKAFQGAMMISCYRDEPRFHQPFQILKLLMDLDSCLTKWRHNHAVMVQRMIGAKMGTGGSSGYHYLRSTVSDRYKIFLDLYLVSNYLIPRTYLPALTGKMKQVLSTMEKSTVYRQSDCQSCVWGGDKHNENGES